MADFPRPPHGNIICVDEVPHHLYVIYDYQYSRILKFGICGEPLLNNGESPRVNKQLTERNNAEDFIRFRGRILIKDIKGRIRALVKEDDFIDLYRAKYEDEFPRGNRNHPYLGRKYTYLLIEAGEDL